MNERRKLRVQMRTEGFITSFTFSSWESLWSVCFGGISHTPLKLSQTKAAVLKLTNGSGFQVWSSSAFCVQLTDCQINWVQWGAGPAVSPRPHPRPHPPEDEVVVRFVGQATGLVVRQTAVDYWSVWLVYSWSENQSSCRCSCVSDHLPSIAALSSPP